MARELAGVARLPVTMGRPPGDRRVAGNPGRTRADSVRAPPDVPGPNGFRRVRLSIRGVARTVYTEHPSTPVHTYSVVDLEARKVQKLGYSSVGISLPKEWAEANGLKPGTLVSLTVDDDGTLRVRAGPLEEPVPVSEATVDADAWPDAGSLTRVITGNYIVGRNTIRVRSRGELSPEQLQEVHEAVRGLTGLTIVNQGPKFVTIENFAEPTRFPIDGLLRRLHYLTSRMERLALGVLAGEAPGNISEVARMEAEVDRLYWLVVRQLLLAAKSRNIAGKIGELEPRHLLGDRVVTVILENIGDLWEDVASGTSPLLEACDKVPEPFAEAMRPVKADLERIIDLAMNAFFASDLPKANEALHAASDLEGQLGRLEASIPQMRCDRKADFCSTCSLLRAVVRPLHHITKYYATVAQITINRSLEEVARR